MQRGIGRLLARGDVAAPLRRFSEAAPGPRVFDRRPAWLQRRAHATDGGQTLRSGKYAGYTFDEVLSQDPGYCNWVKTKAQQMQTDDFKDFAAFLLAGTAEFAGGDRGDDADGGDTVLEFGRMRGKTFGEVARSDPKYCAWFLKSAESAQDGSRERSANCVAFIDFLRARGPIASESRRPRWQADAAQEGELASGLWEVAFGKHMGHQFKEVYETDTQYCIWMLEAAMHGECVISWEQATFLLYVQHRLLQERGGAPGGPTH